MEDDQVIRLTQDEWIRKYNQTGKVMASAPDFYAGLNGCDDDSIRRLHDHLNRHPLILSTRITYDSKELENPHNLKGRITHYFGSTVTEPIETDLVIPVFRDKPIEEALILGDHAKQGLAYLQGLLGTTDSAEEIIQTLERASGKNREEIRIWTAETSGSYSRATHKERVILVSFTNYGKSYSLGETTSNIGGLSLEVSTGGAWLTPNKAIAKPKHKEIQSGILRNQRSVCFSTTQKIGPHTRYDCMFCFQDRNYVVCLVRRKGKRIRAEEIAEILARKGSIDEKVGMFDRFNPVYVHVDMFQDGEKVEDSEGFKSLED